MDIKQKFDLYYDLLIEWNKKFNLTAVTERDKVELLHFKDSLLGEDLFEEGAKVLDVGSGAGFPAIPLKIVRNDLAFTLIDSVNKKTEFLKEVISRLELSDIRAIHTRIEDLKERDFDVVCARAVAPLNVLAEYCLPFVKTGGKMIAYKSRDIDEEIDQARKAIEFLGGSEPITVERELGEEIKRKFVIIKKIKESPQGYPRGGNKPRSKPII